MDFFGIKSKQENEALKKAMEYEPRAQYNFHLIMANKYMEKLTATTIAGFLFWLLIKYL